MNFLGIVISTMIHTEDYQSFLNINYLTIHFIQVTLGFSLNCTFHMEVNV